MTPTAFTPLASTIGGVLIGLSAVLLMLFKGRIAGISGIAVRMFPPFMDKEAAGRGAFIAGLVVAPGLYRLATGSWPDLSIGVGSTGLILAGVLVGFGSVWGSGCTSGHGICGLSRLSGRSLVAVATFMATAIATVFLIRNVL
jgi:uncharacterized protein